ncbi:ABC-type metal ion transporter, periplasmic subunit [Caldalkalibacillus thermarum TA2.A1]|uniref:ABC-type metal ion transporter, periplasmic subunit n=1 Tax=Caldalkalibacillus thermarum (strain TA2.A1) TaxID=986075 RepID=F5L654_CALTT|nr:metal ABC transporter substrate-binding protein [Caldalkalibacillus thermarum]EGL83154.1 ABC-type metal ion transporter, periplasmic subunit [Caldalkalibacillus thermarum TA2.A1]QZT35082.1 metal ABC transporter substrate-binding protein [Caldalkalibacillus thermarum TA2.A1]
MYLKSILVLLSTMLVLSMALMACSPAEEAPAPEEDLQPEEAASVSAEEERLLVYTSLFPLYDFATKIAGERAEVINLIPPGAEPHDFEPTPNDIVNLHKADLFVYNGGGLEGWIEKILEAVDNPDLKVVDSTANVELLTNEETGHVHDQDHDHGHDHGHGKEEDHDHDHDHDHAHGKEEDHDHEHDHGELDPHVWLDPLRAKQQAEAIKDALVEIDPEHAEYYEQNYSELAQGFDELHAKFEEMSQNIQRRDFVVSHEAFGYLAWRYDLNQVGIAGLSPSQEPSPQRMREIIEFVQENEIQYILFENTVTLKVAEVIKSETGAESLVLHNLESLTEEELAQGADYFSIMEQNLDVLKKALGYQE